MAKKLTARQRKARKHASYVKAEYYKNVDAIKYLERYGVTKDITIPNKITKNSLQSIRRIYKEMRASVEKISERGEYIAVKGITQGEVVTKLPTKSQAAKEYREEVKGIQQGLYKPFDADGGYIDELKQKIDMLNPVQSTSQTDLYYNKKVKKQLAGAKKRLLDEIDDAIKKYGMNIVAHALEDNDYMQKIDEYEMRYTYEIIDATGGYANNDTTLFDAIDASVQDTLVNL